MTGPQRCDRKVRGTSLGAPALTLPQLAVDETLDSTALSHLLSRTLEEKRMKKEVKRKKLKEQRQAAKRQQQQQVKEDPVDEWLPRRLPGGRPYFWNARAGECRSTMPSVASSSGQLQWLVIGVGLQANKSGTHRRAGPFRLWPFMSFPEGSLLTLLCPLKFGHFDSRELSVAQPQSSSGRFYCSFSVGHVAWIPDWLGDMGITTCPLAACVADDPAEMTDSLGASLDAQVTRSSRSDRTSRKDL